MKLIGLLPWYLEKPMWLADAVVSLAKCCDHIIAVDGGYMLFPGALDRPNSGPNQSEEILHAATSAGVGVTLHVPNKPFTGNEVEKRTLMLRLAQPLVEPGVDWLLSIDADMVVSYAAPDLKEQLASLESGIDAAEWQLWWNDDMHSTQVGQGISVEEDIRPGWSTHRSLFRAWHNMRVEHTHYTYLAENDEGETVWYWGHPNYAQECDAANLTHYLRIEHRHAQRSRSRMKAAYQYYQRRDDTRIEVMPSSERAVAA